MATPTSHAVPVLYGVDLKAVVKLHTRVRTWQLKQVVEVVALRSEIRIPDVTSDDMIHDLRAILNILMTIEYWNNTCQCVCVCIVHCMCILSQVLFPLDILKQSLI